ncbi:YciI family protein [Corynebacterium ammoniagenes]|uniref:YCII-related domain-containing protein n=2 Tax=Corynebacterium ammoniagenes TaxID=1697 RepID=A0AAV5G215_CORAM|nr:YciI family protein [Corynebacterium ammoniagenes]APT82455.1 hypothetical protein CAMM_05810 [Corynebacterium ammoniagenes DSM 20306]AQS73537.1 hypothetical protein CA40472_06135 [Corynebacterium ammoniagenes]EFG82669.1 hypothetical protein HMPREF0281_00199 [Corynebacterium ammoniagenes DSM 20306]NMF30935.1 hypothetical protein [Corynebacterium ammoniagenes]GJN42284.1 hypothetical protein CAT723_07630 [Corynebacterium ammoniagenes]
MKYFAVIYDYNANNPRLDEVRPQHREFIETLHNQEQILGSGPFTDSKRGALIILKLDEDTTVDDVVTIMDGDPYWIEEIVNKRDIREWGPVTASFEI